MAREKKQRVATDAGPVAWTNPFASLDPGPLPSEPAAEQQPAKSIAAEKLLMRRETAHRGGKTVVVLEGFSVEWNGVRLQELLRELKAALGCGGKIDGNKLEIQGEQADRLQPLLEARGLRVKRGW